MHNAVIRFFLNKRKVCNKALYSVPCSSMLRLVFSQCFAFNSNIFYLPDMGRKDTAEFFQVGDVEQGNFLINKFFEVQLEAVIWSK